MPQQLGGVTYEVRIAGNTAILMADGRTVATQDLTPERAARLGAPGEDGEHLRGDLCQMWVVFRNSTEHAIDTDDPGEVCRLNGMYGVVQAAVDDPSVTGFHVARTLEVHMSPLAAMLLAGVPRGGGGWPSI